jgi:hypothetical protein
MERYEIELLGPETGPGCSGGFIQTVQKEN